MKKYLMMLLSITVLTVLLTGCGNSSREQELEKQINQLEQQIADMQQTTDDGKNTGSENTTADSSTTADDAATNANTDTSADTSADTQPSDMNTLSSKVTEAVSNADATKPTGTANENQTLFFEQKSALDALDRELDIFEDNLEAQYRQGTLNYTDFRKQDRELEKLEDMLDDAEDRLENRFGMDD
ncbi:MAG: hypothetical protein Q4C40_01945 [Eubacteriales bacterium]|nr:hypothetical protein [Eubacteriales bacterium]